MEIVIATISILAITAFVWFLDKFLPFRVCPICAGVSATWLWILLGVYLGWLEAGSWELVSAIAMGGSVVGVAYQIEKRLPQSRSPLLWKTLFLPTGFIAVYSVLSKHLLVSLAAVLVMVFLALIFLPKTGETINKKVEELKEKMKQCC